MVARILLRAEGLPTMTSTPKSQALLAEDVLRAVYRRGLDLPPGERATFEVVTVSAKTLRLSVRNRSEGLVEVACADKLVCAQLQSLVGISVVFEDTTESNSNLRAIGAALGVDDKTARKALVR